MNISDMKRSAVLLDATPQKDWIDRFYKPPILSFSLNSMDGNKLLQEIDNIYLAFSQEENGIDEGLKSALKDRLSGVIYRSETERDSQIERIAKEWCQTFYAEQGIKTFAENQFKQSLLDELTNLELSSLVCSDFAFLHLGEDRAYKTSFRDLSSERNPLEILHAWGYQLVNSPQPGDLVVYGEMMSENFNAKHYGIWTSNERVLSKWGFKGNVYEHPLDLTLKMYGSSVLFLRKELYHEIFEKIPEIKAQKDQTLENLIQDFEGVLKRKLKACHPNTWAYHFYSQWLESLGSILDKIDLSVDLDSKKNQWIELARERAKNIPFILEPQA